MKYQKLILRGAGAATTDSYTESNPPTSWTALKGNTLKHGFLIRDREVYSGLKYRIMRCLLILVILATTAFFGKAQSATDTQGQLKALLQKSNNLKLTSNVDVKDFSEIKIESAPCEMKYYYKMEWEDDHGDSGGGSYMAQIKWADVSSVSADAGKFPTYIKLISNDKKFNRVVFEEGKPKNSGPQQVVYIAAFFRLPDGAFDKVSYDKALDLIKQAVKSCGGKTE